MGQTLSEPNTTKHSASCENARFKVGSSSMQGWRVTMEDAHTHILSLPEDNDTAFFAVYDGHGGSAISKYASNNLHKLIIQRQEYKNGNIAGAFSEAFLEIDQIMLNDSKLKNEISGTTAVTCLIKGDKLFCGNVGDSRAVASINGKCHPLSYDHKPNNPLEETRIKEAGGWVEFNRVNGNLALSRALGDFSFKRNPNKVPEQQMVTAVPDIMEKTIAEDWEFVLLACDGIWDVLTNEEACELVLYALGSGMEPEKVCEDLLRTCLAPDCQMGGLGCDNMTVILVCLLHGQSWSSYCSKIASSLDSDCLAANTRRMRDLSVSLTDSSSDGDDNDEVISSDKIADAKSIDASLCVSLAKSRSPSVSGSQSANNTLVNNSEPVENVLQADEYIHNTDKAGAGEVVTLAPATAHPSNNPNTSSSAELLGALNSEVFGENQLGAQQQQQRPTDDKSGKSTNTN